MPHTRIVTRIRYSFLILSLALLALTMKPSHGLARASAAAKPNDPMPGLQGQPAIDYLKQHGLFESVKAAKRTPHKQQELVLRQRRNECAVQDQSATVFCVALVS